MKGHEKSDKANSKRQSYIVFRLRTDVGGEFEEWGSLGMACDSYNMRGSENRHFC